MRRENDRREKGNVRSRYNYSSFPRQRYISLVVLAIRVKTADTFTAGQTLAAVLSITTCGLSFDRVMPYRRSPNLTFRVMSPWSPIFSGGLPRATYNLWAVVVKSISCRVIDHDRVASFFTELRPVEASQVSLFEHVTVIFDLSVGSLS